jgi:hypothetical protein
MAWVAEALSILGVVVAGASEVPIPRLLGEGSLELPSPLDAMKNSSTESSIMAHRGVGAPLHVEPMKAAPASPPPGGEAQSTEVVGDELKVPKMNSFAEGESTARQTFTLGRGGDRR